MNIPHLYTNTKKQRMSSHDDINIFILNIMYVLGMFSVEHNRTKPLTYKI